MLELSDHCCCCGKGRSYSSKLYRRGKIQKLSNKNGYLVLQIVVLFVCKWCYEIIKDWDISIFQGKSRSISSEELMKRIAKHKRIKDPFFFWMAEDQMA